VSIGRRMSRLGSLLPAGNLTPSQPPPFRRRRRSRNASDSATKLMSRDQCILLPLPLKGGGWEGVNNQPRKFGHG
jgi:hypothetical protein